MRLPRLCALSLLLAGCAHATPTPEPTADIPTASPIAPAPPASSSAPAAKAPPGEPEPEDTPPDCSDEQLARRTEALDKARARGNRAEVYQALEAALEIGPRNIDLRQQLARLLHEDKKFEEASDAGRALVELNGGRDAFGWLLVGLGAEARGDHEAARASLARSAAIDPNGPAAQKLGSRSRCPAAARAPDADDRITIVQGWIGVFKGVDPERMVREELPEPTTEAEAKKRSCISGDLREITDRDVCKGKGPWTVQTGHLHFHDHNMIILPLPGGRFALYPYITGAGCRGGSSSELRLHGNIIEVSTSASTSLASVNLSSCDITAGDMAGPCLESSEFVTTFHDARTGKALLRLEDREATEQYSIKGSTLRRAVGKSCDETLDLRKLPAPLKPRP